MKKTLTYLTLSLLIGTLLYSCKKEEDNIKAFVPKENTEVTDAIVTVLIENGELDSMVKAINIAGLTGTYFSPGTFTLFAPSNAAFANYINSDSTLNKVADIGAAKLKNWLKYGTLGNILLSSDITTSSYGYTLNTQGANNELVVLELDFNDSARVNDVATVIQADIMAMNGVIHVIDTIVTPRTVMEFLQIDESFSYFLDAVNLFGDTITNVLGMMNSYTLFVPINKAFQEFIDSDSSLNSLTDINRVALKNILMHHILANRNLQTRQITDSMKVPTLLGDSILFGTNSGIQLLNADTSIVPPSVAWPNLQCKDGVIHAIGKVALP